MRSHGDKTGIVDKVMSEMTAKISEDTVNAKNIIKLTSGIKDKQVRKIAGRYQDKMKKVWDEEIAAGARKKSDPIGAGYVRRKISRGEFPENINSGFFSSRKKNVPTIEESIKQFKEGKLPYMFEADAAKNYAATLTRSNAMIMRKQYVDWLEHNLPATVFKKAGKESTEGLVRKELWGKFYEMSPELGRELTKIAPQLSDVGMSKFLRAYDKIQNNDDWQTPAF